MYEALPKNEKYFDVDITGIDTGVRYQGQFKVKCVLDIAGKHALALEKTRLMADYANPSPDLQAIAIALATVRAKIIDAPAWWKEADDGAKLIDENVIIEIYDKCNEAEDEWRKKLKESAQQAKKEMEEKKND